MLAVNGYIKGYSGRDFLLPKLAGFLMGAGENSYFESSGTYWTCAGDRASTTTSSSDFSSRQPRLLVVMGWVYVGLVTTTIP